MPVELVILAFIIIVSLCCVSPQYYFLVTFGGLLLLALFAKKRSRFVDGDSADMKLGETLAKDGEYGNLIAISSDLDSGADLDELLKPKVTDGDDQLSTAMKRFSERSRDAVLARARFTSDNFRRYFQEELDAAEYRHWWEDESNVEGTVKDERHYESDEWAEEHDPEQDEHPWEAD